MKIISYFICSLFCFLLLASPIYASSSVPTIIINQLRGDEACCLPGDKTLFDRVYETEERKKLPVNWAVRFDVFKDDAFVASLSALPKNQLGALLEITPALATASGIVFRGKPDGSDWHEARNAFLVGYTQSERQKLIDTYMGVFKGKFGATPQFSVSWMIDSWSLQYLHDHYGVVAHELTKEQYETDAYTLYGGMFNLPYLASKSHPLVPDASGEVLLMRQTVSDIDKNYGSFHAWYTSQPNDYLGNPEKKNISYFESLLTETKIQDEVSAFALVGLENSLTLQPFFDEYLRQIDLIYQKQQAGEVVLFTPSDYKNKYQSTLATHGRFLKSQNFPASGTLWYFGSSYRARIENWNNTLVLTDLRIYPSSLTDPYATEPATKSHSYWVVPYLLDSSQEFSVISKDLRFEGNPVRTDSNVSRFGIEISDQLPTDISREGEALILKNAADELARFNPDMITVAKNIQFTAPAGLSAQEILENNTPQYVTIERHPRFFLIPNRDQQTIVSGWESPNLIPVPLATFEKTGDTWELTPNASVSAAGISSLAGIFQPDRTTYKFDPGTSTVYWNNVTAVAGRNPIRVFIDPRNSLKRPVSIGTFSVVASNPDFQVVKPESTSQLFAPFFIDITSASVGTGTIRLTADSTILADGREIRFYRDCFKEFTLCIKDREELRGFAEILIQEKIAEFRTRLEILSRTIQMEVVKQLQNLSTKIPKKP